mgnify:CR=1 FL=1
MLNLKKLFKPNAEWNAAHALYAASVSAGRDQVFFGVWGVPDSAEGRFEALSMVAFLALRRLKQPPLPSSLGQAYDDTALTVALGKFLFRGVTPSVETLVAACGYMRAQAQHLADQHDAQLSTGTISFAPAESMSPS